MKEQQARLDICEAGRRLWQRGHVAANDGNISARLDDGNILCTPTGVSKGFMQPQDLCVVDLDGNHRSGPKVSVEVATHLAAYRLRPDVEGVVHAHPPTITAYACSGRSMAGNLLVETVLLGLADLPTLRCAPPGAPELAEDMAPVAEAFNVFLMANHGALTVGADVFSAYHRMEALEHSARIAMLAEQLGPKPMTESEIAALLAFGESLKAKVGY
jgi:L-fuculose-phosphate aldolase